MFHDTDPSQSVRANSNDRHLIRASLMYRRVSFLYRSTRVIQCQMAPGINSDFRPIQCVGEHVKINDIVTTSCHLGELKPRHCVVFSLTAYGSASSPDSI